MMLRAAIGAQALECTGPDCISRTSFQGTLQVKVARTVVSFQAGKVVMLEKWDGTQRVRS